MNIYILSIMSYMSLIISILTINGYTYGIEMLLWILFGMIAVLVLSRNVVRKIFLHGLIIGIAWGLLDGCMKVMFFNHYWLNNTHLLIDKNFSKTFIVLSTPLESLKNGLILGIASVLFRIIWIKLFGTDSKNVPDTKPGSNRKDDL